MNPRIGRRKSAATRSVHRVNSKFRRESRPESKPGGESKGLWYKFCEGLVSGLAAAIVILAVNVPATIYVTEHAKSTVAAQNALRPVTSEVQNELPARHSLFHPVVEVWNPGPRDAVGTIISVKPLLGGIRLNLESVTTVPSDASIDFHEERDIKADWDSHIVTIPRLRNGQKLILHYTARSLEYIPASVRLKLLKMDILESTYRDPLSQLMISSPPGAPHAVPLSNEQEVASRYLLNAAEHYQKTVDVYTDADAAGNHFVARGEFYDTTQLIEVTDLNHMSMQCSGTICFSPTFDGAGVPWAGLNFQEPSNCSLGICGTMFNGVVANAAIIPARANGSVSIYASDPTDVVVDINGYFAPATNGLYDLTGSSAITFLARASIDAQKVVFMSIGGDCGSQCLTSNEPTNSFDDVDRNAAFVYENAVALIHFVGRDLAKARTVADRLAYASSDYGFLADRHLRNGYQGSDLYLPRGCLSNTEPMTVWLPGWCSPYRPTFVEAQTALNRTQRISVNCRCDSFDQSTEYNLDAYEALSAAAGAREWTSNRLSDRLSSNAYLSDYSSPSVDVQVLNSGGANLRVGIRLENGGIKRRKLNIIALPPRNNSLISATVTASRSGRVLVSTREH